MNNTVYVVFSGQYRHFRAPNKCHFPQFTRERYVNKWKEDLDYKIDKTAGKLKNIFMEQQELETESYVICHKFIKKGNYKQIPIFNKFMKLYHF